MSATSRREAILAAAAGVFAAEGYDGASTARIARAAGVSEPLLYRHFSGKDELFCAVLDWAAAEILIDWERAAAGMRSTRERLLALATLRPHLLSGSAWPYLVLQAAPANLAVPGVRQALAGAYRRLEQHLAAIIREGQRRREFKRGIDPQAAAWTLLSLGLAYRLTTELELAVATEPGWMYSAGSRYLDTLS